MKVRLRIAQNQADRGLKMAEITASLVKELRERTGAGMME
ncbi:hypothetical protein AAUPMC_20431 [Pasteurella multocida subsp. multocida str. Anand1_cattle]|nr:hypothetical protein AAUPMC_20431 [Pasteurella multocida subsp. multocida str. Anand1_cattle]